MRCAFVRGTVTILTKTGEEVMEEIKVRVEPAILGGRRGILKIIDTTNCHNSGAGLDCRRTATAEFDTCEASVSPSVSLIASKVSGLEHVSHFSEHVFSKDKLK
jgi:hypothetical protein